MINKDIRIVIISFEMHPVISARSFRTTELAKQFARMGLDVTLYTVWRNNNFNYEQYGNETGIKIKNLGSGNYTLGKNPLMKVLNRLLAYPMIKVIPKVKKAIESESPFDYLISIAAPHPIHWGASFVKGRPFKRWIADCGDPYMKNPFAYHPFYFKWIEKRWCRRADFITVPLEEAKMGYYKEFREKIRVIPQGFSFEDIKLAPYEGNRIPTFAYAGTCYKNGRDITPFLEYLSHVDFDFKFLVYTNSPDFFDKYAHVLKGRIEINKFIPRDKLLYELSKVDFLINIKNDYAVQSPSKLIDYSLTQRPILDITSSFTEQQSFLQFVEKNYEKQVVVDRAQFEIGNVARSFIDLLQSNK